MVIAAAVVAALAGCSPPAEEPVAAQAPEGREETRNIRNTEAVGYSGPAIADRVDAALDAGEARDRQLREQDPEAPQD
jgi:hypothetical protein